MDETISSATTLSTPTDQVEALIHQVAEENGLEMIEQLQDISQPGTSIRQADQSVVSEKKEDDLSRRCVNLLRF